MNYGIKTTFMAASIALGSLFVVAAPAAPASAASIVVHTGPSYNHGYYRHHHRYHRRHHGYYRHANRHYRHCWTKTRRVHTHHGWRVVKKRYCR